MHISQPIPRASSGGSVSALLDVALSSSAWERPLQLVVRKGALNASTARVFLLVTGRDPILVRRVDHVGDLGGENALAFTIAPSARGAVPASTIHLGRATRKLLWAFYYPWYSVETTTVCAQGQRGDCARLRDGPIEPYGSGDPDVIARHVDQARWAGIDGFLSSWWGPNDFRDDNLRTLFAVASQRNFLVAPYLEIIGGNGPLGAGEITRWLEYFIGRYRNEPALMKLDGKPLIVVWQSPQVPLDTWRGIFGDLRAGGFDAAYLALGFDTRDLDVFDGLHFYGSFEGAAAAFARAGHDVRYYPLLREGATPKIWAASAEPGYDDRLLPGRTGTLRERNDGATYRASLDAAAASEPDWIFITSWNEFPESTYIEPSKLYGEQYLRITREFALRWKGS